MQLRNQISSSGTLLASIASLTQQVQSEHGDNYDEHEEYGYGQEQIGRAEWTTGQVTEQINLSIVSNSQLLRDSLATSLARHLDICLIGSHPGTLPDKTIPFIGSSTSQLTTSHVSPQLSDRYNPPSHVVLLDASVGDTDAVTWTRYWRGLTPPARVIVLELANDPEVVLPYIEAGASGYTLQGASVLEVAQAIERAQQGVAVCSPEMTAQLFARLAVATTFANSKITNTSIASGTSVVLPFSHNSLISPISPFALTARERQVLVYLVRDFSNQEIAQAMVIEISTVKYYVHNILEKLGVSNRRYAARLAIERGWLNTPEDKPDWAHMQALAS